MTKTAKKNALSDDQKNAAENQIVEIAKTIDYQISEYTVEILEKKLSDGDMEIPEYQREFTWEEPRQCKFIESILMGLPIPFLFFWEIPASGKLEVVDGSQRLRTIQSFLKGHLTLKGLESLPLLNGFSYNDLKDSRQRKFNNKSIRGIILSEKADFQSRLDLFDRINTGSKVANYAEIRRATLSGGFMQMVIELAKNKLIMQLIPVSTKRENEREREELITRFFAYGDGLSEYKDQPRHFLDSYTAKMNEEFKRNPKLKKEYKERIITVFNFINTYFPDGFKKISTAKSIPRARFESIAIGCYLAIKQNPSLKPSKTRIDNLLKNEIFAKEIRSDGANIRSRLEGRINITKDLLLRK